MAAIEDPPPPDDPPPPTPDPALPGLGAYMVKRYTSNLVINEEMSVVDLLYDVIFPSSRMFMSQGANGKIRLQNKKPVDFALGTGEFAATDTVIELDDVMPWVDDPDHYLLIAPHTNLSEVRTVVDANYTTAQNSVTFTASDPDFDITGFSGCDGASTPATASVQVTGYVADTEYTVTLDGVDIVLTPSASNTVDSIASFLAGAFKGNPALSRKFQIDWDGADTVNLTALFGTLTLNSALENTHIAPEADPTTAPTLTATASGSFAAGDYRVAYAFRNLHGQTLLSPYKSVTLSASQKITVTTVTPPAGFTVMWYVSCEAGSTKLRFHVENDGTSFVINSLPLLTAPLPPDLNRTGTEVMRVMAVFSDREETRSAIGASNVIRATFKWSLGNREKSINRIDLKWRDSNQDWRLIESRFRDDANIAKIKKINKFEINGQAIDNYFQAYRIGAGELAERRDADFFYTWSATRVALLLEEGDVVAITDNGSGVVNFPVRIEAVELDAGNASLPKASFTARKYSSTLYDDSVVERSIAIVTEN